VARMLALGDSLRSLSWWLVPSATLMFSFLVRVRCGSIFVVAAAAAASVVPRGRPLPSRFRECVLLVVVFAEGAGGWNTCGERLLRDCLGRLVSDDAGTSKALALDLEDSGNG